MTFKLRLPYGSNAKERPEEPAGPSYHAVSICAGKEACAAARSVSGKRVLSAEALLLPLADCDQLDRCTCRYRHHDDRRAQPRRRAEGAPPTDGAAECSERRATKGRRSEDHYEYDDMESHDEDTLLEADTYYGHGQRVSAER